jgi:hypothetical protein
MKKTRLLFPVKEAAELLAKALGWVGTLQQAVQRVYYMIRMGRLQAFKFKLPHKSARCPSMRVFLSPQFVASVPC